MLAACTALVGLSAIAAIDPAPGRQADKRTKLLFSSGFEHPVTVAPPRTEKR